MDYAEIPANLASDYFTVFQDIGFWKDVWEMSIALSIISYTSSHDVNCHEHNTILGNFREFNLAENLREKLVNCISIGSNKYVDPSKVLSELLSLNVGQLQLIRNRCTHDIRTIYKQSIRRAVHIFIDSFDQALNEQFHYYPEIWKAGQLGLMRACFEMNRHNSHIKIYTAIRQEAYADFHHGNQMAKRGATLLLRPKKAINLFHRNSIIPDSMRGLCKNICAHVNEHRTTKTPHAHSTREMAPTT